MLKKIALFLVVMATPLSVASYVYAQRQYQFSDAALQQRYQDLNNWYFDGSLPKNAVVGWADIPLDHSLYVMGDITEDSLKIEIDTKSNITKSTVDLTLLHEMCHSATQDYERAHNEDLHGPRFQACMMNLAKEGAMQDIW